MSEGKAELPHGTLDLLILQTLHTLGPRHGYGIARRIEQLAGTERLSQGAIYPALIRLEQQGWIRTQWGTSETNRRVKIYSLTRPGANQLQAELRRWRKTTAMMARFFEARS
jgi:transcriptional regulator